MVLNFQRNDASYSPEKREQVNRLNTKMIERVVHPYNLQKAVEQVVSNKGSAGVDGIKTSQLKTLFPKRKDQLLEAIRQGNYQPQPILGVEIPKGEGKTRLLGVPTTTDRVLQQAVSQVIAPLFEPEFSHNSFGFRPNKNARQAVGQARDYIHQGLNHIVDIDLKNFFDEVDHCLLLNLVYQKVKCKTTMRLIRNWLRVPIRINGKLQKRRKGVPQGGGALRKCPVDIFSERASRRAGKGRERISYDWALTQTTLMLLVERGKAVGQLRRVLS